MSRMIDPTTRLPFFRHQTMTAGTGDLMPHAVAWRQRLAGLDGCRLVLERHIGDWSRVEASGLGKGAWPVTSVLAPRGDATALVGAHAWLVPATEVQAIETDGSVVGTKFADEDAEYCVLGNITPARGTWNESRETQMNSLYERAEEALAKAGMQFHHVVRTWMFLDRLLEWYDDFNCLRTVFLEMHDIFNRVLPASTGVGVRNPFGAAVVADLLAIRPKTDKIAIREVASPRQCPATDYQSSFSRAVVIDSPRERTILVSGTASIGAEGETLHVGDVRGQVEESLDVMEQLLGSQRFNWNDVTRGIAYFKHPADAGVFHDICKRRGIPTASYLLAQADICRHSLLFELELDATRM